MLITVQRTQPGPPNVFLPITRRVQNREKNRSSFISGQSQWETYGEKSFISFNEKATKYLLKTKTDETQIHLPNDGLTGDKTDSTQICLTFALNRLGFGMLTLNRRNGYILIASVDCRDSYR